MDPLALACVRSADLRPASTEPSPDSSRVPKPRRLSDATRLDCRRPQPINCAPWRASTALPRYRRKRGRTTLCVNADRALHLTSTEVKTLVATRFACFQMLFVDDNKVRSIVFSGQAFLQQCLIIGCFASVFFESMETALSSMR